MSVTADKLTSPELASGKYSATQKHIRGSSLLLAGRFLSLAANFAIQVLTVRALTKSDYGAFAYALAVVSFGANITVFGLDKTISRFIPIYQENKDHKRLLGTIVMTIGAILSLGIALVLVVAGLQEILNDAFINDETVAALIVVLVALAPLQALDSLFGSMLAIFAGPRAVFFRRYLLNPGLKLAVVLLVLFVDGDVWLMANGYLLAGILGVVVYSALLWHILRGQGLFEHVDFRSMVMPVRAIFGFSLPLLTTDLVYLLRNFMVIVVLQYFHTTSDVAAFRAVLPVAGLNMFVYESFTFLYMPTASRMYARKQWGDINELYWQSATWIAITSFPVLVLTFSLAEPLTVQLFGERYSQSGMVLAILAVGHFVNAALGFNAFTLRVYGKVRSIVLIDIAAALISLAACLVLVPRYGVMGAAVAVTTTMIIHNLLNQAGLALTTDIHMFEWRYLKAYVSIALASVALFLIQRVLVPPVPVMVGLGIVVLCVFLFYNRSVLNVSEMFPEVLRLPFMRHLLGQPKNRVVVDGQS